MSLLSVPFKPEAQHEPEPEPEPKPKPKPKDKDKGKVKDKDKVWTDMEAESGSTHLALQPSFVRHPTR